MQTPSSDQTNTTAHPLLRHMKSPHRPKIWLLAAITLIIIILIAAIWHHAASEAALRRAAQKHPVPVVAATARLSNVPVYLSALGTVTPTYTVTVRTQVNGTLLRVLYTEGQIVKEGDLLAEIDPRPFLAQLIEFQGQLARDAAQLANARVDLKRYKKLFPQGAVSEQVYATQAALVKQLEGTVQFDQGQIETVQVNLIYTKITAPIAGRVGLRLVDPGNFVQTSDTNGLVVINTISPITVIFAISEDNIPPVAQQVMAGKKLKVNAYDRTQNKLLAVGSLLTMDNQINTTTGTVNLKAQFANKDYRLFPNQFVNIGLLVDVLHNAVVVPTTAIQTGPQGTFVYVINKDNTVSVRTVKTGVVTGEATTISSGIIRGEPVVIEGSDKLSEGAKVKLTNPNKQPS